MRIVSVNRAHVMARDVYMWMFFLQFKDIKAILLKENCVTYEISEYGFKTENEMYDLTNIFDSTYSSCDGTDVISDRHDALVCITSCNVY